MSVSVLLGFSFASFAMFWHYGESSKDTDEGEQESGASER